MGITAPAHVQAQLLDLQALDAKAQNLSGRLARLPEEEVLRQTSEERDALAATVAQRRGDWEDAVAERARISADREVVEARIARDTGLMQSSSSPKDIAGLELELASLTKRRADLDEMELVVWERADAAEALLTETQSALDALSDALAAARDARDRARAALESERSDALAQRARLAESLPADLLALYERQRERYGVGASHLSRGVSSASGVALNPTDLERIRQAPADEVLLCPDSNAILVRTDESGL